MRKERMTFKKAKKHRQQVRWWHTYGNYVAAAAVFMIALVVVIILAITMTINGGQQAGKAQAAGTMEEPVKIHLTAGVATILESQTAPQPTYETMIASRDWSAHDAELLLKIAMAEAEGESTEGKAIVMLVVLNRAWSDEFPDSIEDVIFQTDPARQFTVTQEGGRWWTTTPDADCVAALEMVENGWDESWGALYFESSKNDTSWHSRNLEFLFQLGNHKFYK